MRTPVLLLSLLLGCSTAPPVVEGSAVEGPVAETKPAAPIEPVLSELLRQQNVAGFNTTSWVLRVASDNRYATEWVIPLKLVELGGVSGEAAAGGVRFVCLEDGCITQWSTTFTTATPHDESRGAEQLSEDVLPVTDLDAAIHELEELRARCDSSPSLERGESVK